MIGPSRIDIRVCAEHVDVYQHNMVDMTHKYEIDICIRKKIPCT